MPRMNQNFTVAGGGIAGLAVALGLARQGASVTVLEQAEAIKEVGAGLQISPNGLRVLDALGIGDEVRACSIEAEAVELRDYRRSGVVAKVQLRRERGETGYYFAHRADLIDILASAVRDAGARVRLLQKVDTVSLDAALNMKMCSGPEFRPEVLIGADGVRSVVRPAINGSEAPFFTGQVAWRAIVPNVTGQKRAVRVYMGPKRHMVVYPLRDGSMLNVVAVKERSQWAAEGWSQPDDPSNLRAAFHEFGPEPQRILAEIKDVNVWGLFRHPVAEKWHEGSAVLVGDAAHPTLPFLAQGANMALEDSYALVAALGKYADVAQAFSVYQNVRRARAVRVIEAANGNAWKYHLSGPVRIGAHLGMGLVSRFAPQKLVGSFDWLYGYDVTKEPLLR
ncbi:monooxygenase [Donghicola sp. B5-SW-15]|uniref:Monooxygenase n=2 Tax=Donghicola mangrovi TaxID=2729614 RepID=A0A850Q9R9_9RHOB|nr:monooxygenase [Donghicola mangrovi]